MLCAVRMADCAWSTATTSGRVDVTWWGCVGLVQQGEEERHLFFMDAMVGQDLEQAGDEQVVDRDGRDTPSKDTGVSGRAKVGRLAKSRDGQARVFWQDGMLLLLA